MMKRLNIIITTVTLYLIVHMDTTNTQSPPAGCAELTVIIPDCDCEPALGRPNDIVINCRKETLTTMPVINGSYDGLIYEFTLAGAKIEELPEDAFQGLKIEKIDATLPNLKNISDFAFRGLADNLKVLKFSGDTTSPLEVPSVALSELVNLEDLTLQNFRVNGGHLDNHTHLQPFSKLVTLTLDSMDLKSIGNDAFLGLTSLKELIVTKQSQLETYPAMAMNHLQKTLEKVSFTETGITGLLDFSFQNLPKLKTLVFERNQIHTIESECFDSIENQLEDLDLSFNSIPIDQLPALGKLRALKTLRLQSIGLVALTPNPVFLVNKTNLEELNLAQNHLITIPSNAFRVPTRLKTLKLFDNKIETMANDSLSGLTSLEFLSLDSQTIAPKTLSLPSLASLTSLSILNLDNTPLSADSWNRIGQVESLTQLQMKNTKLTSIPDEIFRTMTKLAYLDLATNQISSISQKTFVGPKDTLTTIYLSTNQIAKFDSCTFYEYNTSLTLYLINNPLRCDCSLYWLSVAVRDKRITLSGAETCAFPSGKAGQLFSSYDPSDLCGSPDPDPQCAEYYSTTTPTPTTTTTPPRIIINPLVLSFTSNSITITWTVNLPEYVTGFIVLHSIGTSGKQNASRPLPVSTVQYTVNDLRPGTSYQICVEAQKVDGRTPPSCVLHSTKSTSTDTQTTTMDPTTGSQMSNNVEIGVIIGSVIGALLLFAILVAILYLMVIRKKSSKPSYPIQPRNFTRAELPTTGYDSKRYIKKKKDDTTDGNKNNVATISDGKTGPNIGRISAGSYQYLQKPDSQQPKSPPYVNEKQASDGYENDMGMRPLPHPSDAPGYYNPGFRNSTAGDQQPHTYTEINL